MNLGNKALIFPGGELSPWEERGPPRRTLNRSGLHTSAECGCFHLEDRNTTRYVVKIYKVRLCGRGFLKKVSSISSGTDGSVT